MTRLGCIADDFTGATDIAGVLTNGGMRVALLLGVPKEASVPEADAVVVALKTRSVPAPDAVEQSVAAARYLQGLGTEQIFFKYCSTFDSTPAGNIGPVTEALMAALGTGVCVSTPAYPATGRTVFKGHLFVGDHLLSESGMEKHPLNPMTDPNLVRVLSAQTTRPVSRIDLKAVRAGVASVRATLRTLGAAPGVVLADAVSDEDLTVLGQAVAGLPMIAGSAGLAQALPAAYGVARDPMKTEMPTGIGPKAILAGSLSNATRGQIAAFRAGGGLVFEIEPRRAAETQYADAMRFADAASGSEPMLFCSTDSDARSRQDHSMSESDAVEHALARIAQGLVQRGVRSLLVAGGETSGAVVQGLGLRSLQVGALIAPGVPWCSTQLPNGDVLWIALKSGNFGDVDLFTHAFNEEAYAGG